MGNLAKSILSKYIFFQRKCKNGYFYLYDFFGGYVLLNRHSFLEGRKESGNISISLSCMIVDLAIGILSKYFFFKKSEKIGISTYMKLFVFMFY